MSTGSQKTEITVNNVREFLEHIAGHGDRIAIQTYGKDFKISRMLTYSQLVTHILVLSHKLAQEVQPGDRVILYKLDPIEWITSYFAVMAVRGVVVTIDSRASEDYVSDVIDLTNPKFALTSMQKGDEMLHPKVGNSLRVFYRDEIESNGAAQYQILECNTREPAEIIFTSGTWSKPKGVTLCQENIFANLSANLPHFKLKPQDQLLNIIPTTHIYEQMAGLLIPLYYGSKIAYTPLEKKEDFQKSLRIVKPTRLVIVPLVAELLFESYRKKLHFIFSIFRRLVRATRSLPRGIRSIIWKPLTMALGGRLWHIIVGGAPLPHDIDLFFQGIGMKVDVGYGLSETAPVIAISQDQNRKSGEVGKPYPIFQASQNDRGELLVRGKSVFLGYWPELTNTEETWFNTEDVVIGDQKGNIIIKGRSKNMFVYPSGDKAFAEDIEYLVKTLTKANSCCLNVGLGLDVDLRLVTINTGVKPEEILANINAKLPDFVNISQIVFYNGDTLPTTYSRKLNRGAIKEWFMSTQGGSLGNMSAK